MKGRKVADANIKFLFAGVIFFLLIVLMVGIFSFLTLGPMWHSEAHNDKNTKCTFYFSSLLNDKQLSLVFNDSLIYNGISPINSDSAVSINVTEQQNMLFIVDYNNQNILSMKDISQSGKFEISFKDNEFTVLPLE